MDFISFLDIRLMWQILNWISGIIMWISFFFGFRFLVSSIALNKKTDIFLSIHSFTLFAIMLIAQILFDSTKITDAGANVKEVLSIPDILKKYEFSN